MACTWGMGPLATKLERLRLRFSKSKHIEPKQKFTGSYKNKRVYAGECCWLSPTPITMGSLNEDNLLLYKIFTGILYNRLNRQSRL